MKQAFRDKIYSIEVPKLDATSMIALAVAEEEWYSRKRIDLVFLSDDKLNHILLNYIRHKTVENYNRNCRSPHFEANPEEYFYWFKEVNNEIGKVYPFLKKAIGQQITNKKRAIFTERTNGN